MLLKIINNHKGSNEYPFNVESISSFKELDLDSKITIFTGANGSGKSSLLRIIITISESIDIGNGLPVEESDQEAIINNFKCIWRIKHRNGFYLQSEDFITYLQWQERELKYHHDELEAINQEYEDHQSLSYQLRRMPHVGSINGINDYARELNKISHGEGDLEFFKSKLRPNSLYLLDEPETPLSFDSQLSLMLMIEEAISMGCQFIVCTHSPVLMAYPNALLYTFDKRIESIKYEDHPEVNKLKDFLNQSQGTMHYLFNDEE